MADVLQGERALILPWQVAAFANQA